MAVIEDLRKEHQTLVTALGGVDAQMIGTEEGNKTLFGIKEALLAHLSHEDTDFYPVLKKAAETDKKLAKTLEEFADDMAHISKAVLDFFDQYTSASTGAEFSKDFAEIVSNLKERIAMEEDVLFTAFEGVGKI
ncbi:hemerythrin domain-containing protein [bacterium]|nr:hemerythrin domain-containing protein [bacterium]